jgi:hypothetical protein
VIQKRIDSWVVLAQSLIFLAMVWQSMVVLNVVAVQLIAQKINDRQNRALLPASLK